MTTTAVYEFYWLIFPAFSSLFSFNCLFSIILGNPTVLMDMLTTTDGKFKVDIILRTLMEQNLQITDILQRLDRMGSRSKNGGPTETINARLPLNSPEVVKIFNTDLTRTPALATEFVCFISFH